MSDPLYTYPDQFGVPEKRASQSQGPKREELHRHGRVGHPTVRRSGGRTFQARMASHLMEYAREQSYLAEKAPHGGVESPTKAMTGR